jgi:tripartite-type tricarboxylate transporter receptor subunit TctC
MELFKQMAGIDMHGVSYNGDAPALVALLGGHVPFAFNNVVVTLPHIQAGKLRALGVATSQRVPNLPDVPTIAESGLPGYEGLLFYGLVGPARLPSAIVGKLHAAMQKIKQAPEVKSQLARLGAIPLDMSSEQFGSLLRTELEKWTQVIQTAGIQAE